MALAVLEAANVAAAEVDFPMVMVICEGSGDVVGGGGEGELCSPSGSEFAHGDGEGSGDAGGKERYRLFIKID